MSQKPAPQRPIPSRVSNGIPWWLWGLLLVVGGGVGISLCVSLMPEDPETMFQEALAAAENKEANTKDAELFLRNTVKLKKFPEYSRQQKLLEGISLLGNSRPLLAIPLLKEAAGAENDPNKALRSKALHYLGNGYALADQRRTAIQVFETMLKEDENSNSARLNIAIILTEIMAWEEALQHLNYLAEKKYNLSTVLNRRGDIRMDLQQYKEAAEDFEASIKADTSDPTNAAKSEKLRVCYTKIRDFEKAAATAESAERMGPPSTAGAEILLEKGDLKGALAAIEAVRTEAPNAAGNALTYGRIMLKFNTKEKAEEGLVTLRNAVTTSTRDIELYRLIVELAGITGDSELAGLAQQNVDGLDAMNKEFEQKLAEVIKTRDDSDARMQLSDLAHNTGRWELAFRIHDGILRFNPEREAEIAPKRQLMVKPLPQLVSTAIGGTESSGSVPAENSPGKPEENR